MLILFSSDQYFEQIYKVLNPKLGVDLLVTEPAKIGGRHHQMIKNPAHVFAEKCRLTTLTPEKLDEDFAKKLAQIIGDKNSTLGFVFSYGQIIPPSITKLFRRGVLNLHPSLLPKLRGATPIQSAILQGDKETGYSIIKIGRKVDAGVILWQQKVKIDPRDSYETLKDKIVVRALKSLPEVVEKYLGGKIKLIPQGRHGVSNSRKFTKADGELKSNESAATAERKIRAFSTWPKATLKVGDHRLIIHQAKLAADLLVIEKIQVPGRQVISFAEFRRGYPSLLTGFPKFVKV